MCGRDFGLMDGRVGGCEGGVGGWTGGVGAKVSECSGNSDPPQYRFLPRAK